MRSRRLENARTNPREPEAPPIPDCAGSDINGCGKLVRTQDWPCVHEVVAIAIVKGNRDRAAWKCLSPKQAVDQTAERDHVIGVRQETHLPLEGVGGHRDRRGSVQAGRGIEMADRVIAEDCRTLDRKSTRLNSSHSQISYAVFCLKK